MTTVFHYNSNTYISRGEMVDPHDMYSLQNFLFIQGQLIVEESNTKYFRSIVNYNHALQQHFKFTFLPWPCPSTCSLPWCTSLDFLSESYFLMGCKPAYFLPFFNYFFSLSEAPRTQFVCPLPNMLFFFFNCVTQIHKKSHPQIHTRIIHVTQIHTKDSWFQVAL